MAYIVICAVALIASFLTLFSGFGLGSLLLPAFVLFFPVEVAVSATAAVHLLNNLFKLVLVGRHADRRVVLAFGLPALGGAVAGAWLLSVLAALPGILTYRLGERDFHVTWVKLVIGALILIFAGIELRPVTGRRAVGTSLLPLGGLLSGFFGGLSGHQGALRSAFLLRMGLSKEAFVGSGVACSVLVDVARIAVYGAVVSFGALEWQPVAAATLCAFLGAWIGTRALRKVTFAAVRKVVAVLLVLLALTLALGVV